jgi:hypothetical protein
MEYSPLFRLPCILVAMIGFNKTLTPPQPPITDEETAPSTTLEVILKHRAAPSTIKVCLFTIIKYFYRLTPFFEIPDYHLGVRARRGCRHRLLQV